MTALSDASDDGFNDRDIGNGEGSVGSEEVMPVRFTKLETMG